MNPSLSRDGRLVLAVLVIVAIAAAVALTLLGYAVPDWANSAIVGGVGAIAGVTVAPATITTAEKDVAGHSLTQDVAELRTLVLDSIDSHTTTSTSSSLAQDVAELRTLVLNTLSTTAARRPSPGSAPDTSGVARAASDASSASGHDTSGAGPLPPALGPTQ